MAISLGQLDLEALKNYLKIVQGFRTVDDMAGDTEKVSGVSSDLIAQAAINENNELLLDRNTVLNAINLVKINEDGSTEVITGDALLTEDEGQILKTSAVKAANNTADDMRALRNEMYHLKRDMIKSGALAYDPVYNGFIDPFIRDLNVYTEDKMVIESFVGNNITVNGDIDAYDLGQYGALISDTDIHALDIITERTLNEISFNDNMLLMTVPTMVSKTFGIYENGRFIFANNSTSLNNTGKAVNMIYKDGADRIKITELNESTGIAGFASTIVVPAELNNNYLQGISLSLRIIGSPGSIYLELYDYNTDMLYGDPIATSNYLNSNLASNEWKTYEFAFNNQILLEKGHEFLFLVKAVGTSTNNVWSLGGFTEVCNNALHQDTYLYTTNSGFAKEGPDLITNQITDLFIGLSTTAYEQVELDYKSMGLYTGTFELENDIATRCRISFNPRLDDNIDSYQVLVKGAMREGDYVGDFVFADFKERVKYSHTVWANGKESGNEFCYDFVFPQEVNVIEFQIVFKCDDFTADNYEALYAVVACTDNAYIDNGGDN